MILHHWFLIPLRGFSSSSLISYVSCLTYISIWGCLLFLTLSNRYVGTYACQKATVFRTVLFKDIVVPSCISLCGEFASIDHSDRYGWAGLTDCSLGTHYSADTFLSEQCREIRWWNHKRDEAILDGKLAGLLLITASFKTPATCGFIRITYHKNNYFSSFVFVFNVFSSSWQTKISKREFLMCIFLSRSNRDSLQSPDSSFGNGSEKVAGSMSHKVKSFPCTI